MCRLLVIESLEERQLLTAVPTLTTLTASTHSTLYGQAVTFTAAVAVAPPNAGAPNSGTVTFKDGSTVLGTEAVNSSGVASFQAPTLPLGLNVVTASHDIITVAGGGTLQYGFDGGPATAASLNCPQGVAVDSAGNIFVADTLNNRILKVDPSDVISTVAGTGSDPGTGGIGDGGAATAALLNRPLAVAVDTAGDIFIADEGNNRIREVNAGVLATVSPAPTFAITGPSAGTFAVGQNVTIQWTSASVVAGHATTISLGYDRDATAFDTNQHWIEIGVITAANGSAVYSWNTSGVAAGTYCLGGYLYDAAAGKAVFSSVATSIVIA